jgi:uncharacterized protein YoxC
MDKNKNPIEKVQNKKKIFEIFQGKFKLPPPLIIPPPEFIPSSKVVVFDLDETLGSFSDLYLLWTGIKHVCPEFNDFHSLLDLYPEFLRPNILFILRYIYNKKIEKKCDKIYIYTNNQCLSREWVNLIIQYFNNKMVTTNNIVLFDQIISAFKIGNTNIELSRTSHEKTYDDLICCTMLPKNTEICFIDDTEFMKMKQDKVYYIRPKSYIHPLNISIIIERWVKFGFQFSKLITSPTYWYNWFSLHKRIISSSIDNDEINILVTKKIMASIREFFILSTLYENKYYNYKHNISRKINNTKTFFPIIEKEPVIMVKTVEPVVEIVEPVVEIVEPVVEIVEPVVETVEPVVETVEPIVETVEPVVETVEPVVEIVEPVVETVEPIVETVEPVVETVEPVVETETEIEKEKEEEPIVEKTPKKNKKNKNKNKK